VDHQQELSRLAAERDRMAQMHEDLKRSHEEAILAAKKAAEEKAELHQIEKNQELERLKQQLERAEAQRNRVEDDRKQLAEEFSCSVCSELFVEACTLDCTHSFCNECILTWLQRNDMCPVCRKPVHSEPVLSRTLDNAIERLLPPSEAQERQARLKKVQELHENEKQHTAKLQKSIQKVEKKKQGFLTNH